MVPYFKGYHNKLTRLEGFRIAETNRKILNLYAGLNGIFKFVKAHITHVEINPEIAAELQRQHPHHTVIVGDALQYLEDHHQEFDYTHASPPCDEWTGLNHWTRHNIKPKVRKFHLYRVIDFLQNHVKAPWTVENVKHKFIIPPTQKLGRNYFWSNFPIPAKEFPTLPNFSKARRQQLVDFLGFDYQGNIYDGSHDPLKVLRRCVEPSIGEYLISLLPARQATLQEAGF